MKIDRDYRAKGLDFIAITLDDLVDIKTAVPKFLLADEREDARLFAQRG